MFFADRNRDTTPDLCELLAQAQDGFIIEPETDLEPIYNIPAPVEDEDDE